VRTVTPLLLVACGLVGVTIGSFLNVVVHRVPAGLSIVRPGSSCPSCGHQISPWENIPLVSWVALRGRCHGCRCPISWRYPALEALTGGLFVAAGARFGLSSTLPAAAVFFAGLVALGAIDLERLLLPNKVLYPTGVATTALLVVAAATGGQWHRLEVAVGCGVGAFAVFFGLHALNPRWLGFGDVRLSAVIGVALGWLGVGYLLLGLLVANVAGIAVIALLSSLGRAGRSTKLPYGAFLGFGAVVATFAGGAFSAALLTPRG
jgi:leader peptidase (prepilin peptidase)/N-methyltransferase